MKKWIVGAGLIALAATGYAKTASSLDTSLYLANIKVVKSTEKSGDELYFSVTEFPMEGRGQQTTIPEYPLFWTSTKLDSVTHVKLWSRELKPGESVELAVALIEHDVPPWNLDDLVGAFKVKIKNDNGKLLQEWSKAASKDMVNAVTTDKKQTQYTLIGDGAQYKVNVMLVGKAAP